MVDGRHKLTLFAGAPYIMIDMSEARPDGRLSLLAFHFVSNSKCLVRRWPFRSTELP